MKKTILVLLCLLVFGLIVPNISAHNELYLSKDFIVNGEKSYNNTTIIIDAKLIVNPNATLSLDNVTLSLHSEGCYDERISVLSGGKLILKGYKSSIAISRSEGGFPPIPDFDLLTGGIAILIVTMLFVIIRKTFRKNIDKTVTLRKKALVLFCVLLIIGVCMISTKAEEPITFEDLIVEDQKSYNNTTIDLCGRLGISPYSSLHMDNVTFKMKCRSYYEEKITIAAGGELIINGNSSVVVYHKETTSGTAKMIQANLLIFGLLLVFLAILAIIIIVVYVKKYKSKKK